MKEKLAALDHIIDLCEKSIAKPYKEKRMSVVIKPAEEDDEEVVVKDEDSIDKKAKLSTMLDEMDEEDLIRLYSQLEG